MGIVDVGVILAYSAGIMLIFMISWIFIKPLKLLGRLILNSLLGALFLLIFNYFSKFTEIYIGVNEVTALLLGILGIPGFIALLIVKLIL